MKWWLLVVGSFFLGFAVGASLWSGSALRQENNTIAVNVCVERGGVPIMSRYDGNDTMVECKLPYHWGESR